MLTYLRKNTKSIIMVVAVLFAFSMFYGVGYQLMGQGGQSQNSKDFLKINGKKVDPSIYMQILNRLRPNFPERLKPKDQLFMQNMALGETIDFVIMLEEAKRKVRVSGAEINATIDNLAKQNKFNSVDELRQAVQRSGLSWDEFKNQLKNEILVQKMAAAIRGEVTVSPADLREVRASHILVPDQKTANTIMAQLKAGGNFAALAKKYSKDPGSAKNGGDLGFFSTGAMVKPFEDAAFALKVGEIGSPVKTDFGYHIIKVTDTRSKKFEKGKNPEQEMLKEKQEKAFRNWFYEKKQKARIEILDPGLRAADLMFRGQLGPAEAEYQKAIAQNPNNAYLHLFLGDIYEQTKKLDLAIAQYQDAVNAGSSDPELHIALGQACLKNNKKELALEQFKKASLLAGDNKAYREELLTLFKKLGLSEMVLQEKLEIARIIKKEAFEESLKKEIEKKSKVITE